MYLYLIRSYFAGSNPNCALDWAYQTTQCKNDVLSTPDSSFQYLLVGLSLVLTGLLTVPIYWGSNKTKELFDNFYYIWAKMKNGDEECKDIEWKRRMNFVLDQVKNNFYLIYCFLSCRSSEISLQIASGLGT